MPNLTDLIPPQIKIGLLIAVPIAVVSGGLYVHHVISDRARLQEALGKASAELVLEQQKNQALTQQTNQILETNKNIIEAVKRVKVNSSVYIEKVEAARLAVPDAGGSVLVPGGVPKALPSGPDLPLFKGYSAGRATPGSA
jgi:hypothetical protein